MLWITGLALFSSVNRIWGWRRYALAGLLALSLLTPPGCARPDETWDRVQETGVLRVGMDASFPPFEFIAADGSLAGFDVDLARELGRRLDVEVSFVANLPYDGLYDALAIHHVDVVISALVVNPNRMADFDYSTPYFDAGQVLVVAERTRGVEQMADLDGRSLAVAFGTPGDLEARKWARRLPGLTRESFQTAAEALDAVADGRAEAALVDHVSALEAMEEDGRLVIVGQPVVAEPYAVGIDKESQHLLRAIDEVLADLEADGTLDTLADRWITPP